MTADLNFHAAWIGFLAGCLSGAAQGLLFHNEQWLGGYASWPRRLMRLGHISFFGVGMVNLAFALSVQALGIESPALASKLLLIAAVAMPVVCYVSAVYREFRRLFFIPALSFIAGTGIAAWRFLHV